MPTPDTSGPHTDACIIDAARFGFCDHTRLFAPQALVRAALRDEAQRHARRRRADLLSWLSFLSLLTLFVALTQLLPVFLALGFTCGFLTAALGLYAWGLPRALRSLTDTSPLLPPDARERLFPSPSPDSPRPPPDSPRTPPRT